MQNIDNEIEYLVCSVEHNFGSELNFRILCNKRGRTEIAIIIDEHTTIDEIKNNWNFIKKMRDEINKSQGPDILLASNFTKFLYHLIHDDIISYRILALSANKFLTYSLKMMNTASIEGDDESFSEIEVLTFHFLKSFSLKDSEIMGLMSYGLEEISKGREPWTKETGPVNKSKVRETLRKWEKELEKVDKDDLQPDIPIGWKVSSEYRSFFELLINILEAIEDKMEESQK